MLVLPQKLPPMFPSLCCKLLISYKFNALHMESKDNELHGVDSGGLDLRARIISEVWRQRLLARRRHIFPRNVCRKAAILRIFPSLRLGHRLEP